MDRYDGDGSGLIEFEEFVNMFIANKPPFASKLPKLVVAELESMLTQGQGAEIEQRILEQQAALDRAEEEKQRAIHGAAAELVHLLEMVPPSKSPFLNDARAQRPRHLCLG